MCFLNYSWRLWGSRFLHQPPGVDLRGRGILGLGAAC